MRESQFRVLLGGEGVTSRSNLVPKADENITQ